MSFRVEPKNLEPSSLHFQIDITVIFLSPLIVCPERQRLIYFRVPYDYRIVFYWVMECKPNSMFVLYFFPYIFAVE